MCVYLSLQAYMSALTSSVDLLEQRASQLGSSGSSLAGQLDVAFGTEAQQREAAADVQLTNTFRVRIYAWHSLALLLHRVICFWCA